MNTFQIFEQFRGPLGEEAAKALAQTLGAMFAELKDSVTKEDFRSLREASDVNFARIDSVVERLVEAQAQTETGPSGIFMGKAVSRRSRSRSRP